MNRKFLSIALLIGVFTVAGAFYGGIQYAQNQSAFAHSFDLSQTNTNSQNKGGMMQDDMMGNGMMKNMRGGMMQNMQSNPDMVLAAGEIAQIDDGSLTLKNEKGEMRKVMIDSSTQLKKSEEASMDDLEEGKRASVIGRVNPDGSITAQVVQVKS